MATAVTPEAARGVPDVRASVRTRLTAMLADPRRALCATVLTLTAVVGLDATGDPDVWWHLRLGQWILANHRVPTTEMFAYTAQGSPFTTHEWLSEVVFAALFGAGGLLLVALAMGAVAWGALLLTALRGRLRGAGPYAIALGTALGAKAAQPVLGSRPQVFTFALLCLTLWLADTYLRRGGRRVWLLPALFVLWANLHAGFVVGLGFLALVVAGEAAKRRFALGDPAPASRIRTLAAVAGVSALAACANPAGPGLYQYALLTGATQGGMGIVEWQPPNFHDPAMWALLALLVSFAALPALGGRLDARDALLAAAGTGLALFAVRNTAPCVAVVVPVWIGMAGDVGRRLGRRRAAAHGSVLMGTALIAVAALAVGYAASRVATAASPAGIAASYPACATGVLARSPSAQRVFAAYGQAGYVIERAWPLLTVYEYGGTQSLSTAALNDYNRIAAGTPVAPTALQLLDASGTTAVLYPRGDLTAQLDLTPGWTRIADDHGTLLYLRGDASGTAGTAC